MDAVVDAYNCLPYASEVIMDHYVVPGVLQAAIHVFHAHAAGDELSLSLAHRHFTLEQGDVVAWVIDHGTLLSRPVSSQSNDFVPIAWTISHSGDIFPYEFAIEQLLPPSIRTKIRSAEFQKTLSSVLTELHYISRTNQFGVSISPVLFSSYFGETAVPGSSQAFLEITNEHDRVSHIGPKTPSDQPLRDDVVDTVWTPLGGTWRVAVGCGGCHPKS